MSATDLLIVGPNYNNTYGFPFEEFLGKGSIQFHRELFAYKILRGKYGRDLQKKYGIDLKNYGFYSPFTHLCNAIQLGIKPGAIEIISPDGRYVNDYLLTVLHTLCNEDDVGVAGSASTGKTFGVSVWALFDWLAAPESTTTLMGSTTVQALDDRIWGETTSLYRQLLYPAGELVDYRRSIVYGKEESIDGQREYRNAIKTIAIERGLEGKKVLENLRGRKNDRYRVIIDELAEMDMYVTDLRVNLAANQDLMFVGIGNPHPGRNPHYELCLPEGYTAFPPEHRDWRVWKTRTGVCVFLSGEKSPNMRAPEDEDPPFPRLMTRDKLALMLKYCHGNVNALEYWRNAVGGWPPSGIQMTVLTKDMLLASDTSKMPIWSEREPLIRIGALDPSFTAGGDRAILTLGVLGYQTSMSAAGDYSPYKRVAYMEHQINIQPSAVGDFKKNLAVEVVNKLIAYGVKPKNFGLDVSNDGGIVAQEIIREWMTRDPEAVNIYLISSQGGPTERCISDVDKRKACDVYDRRVSEYWFAFKTAVETRCIFGLDTESECAEEFYSRQYFFKNRKQAVIPKDEMKVAIGKSPDFSDSACYFLEMCRREGLQLNPDEDSEEISMEDLRRGYYNIDNRGYERSDDEFASYGSSDDWTNL